MIRCRFFLLLFFLHFLLSGCQQDENCIALAGHNDQARYCLLPTAQAPVLNLTQEVQIDWKGQTFTLLSVLESGTNATTMVTLTPTGQTLFSVRQDAQKVALNPAAPLPSGFEPRALLALVQLALWPEEKLRAHLTGCLRLEASATHRTLRCDDAALLDVSYLGRPESYRLQWYAAPLNLQATWLPDVKDDASE
ncbi:MAG: DUF3261 domain-containing protein [Burkholderiaceae bacterium]|nr:MAG: DUF3261 domain-containing protein [Burkholderiaceae bacterium]